jgi:hypothetical protein
MKKPYHNCDEAFSFNDYGIKGGYHLTVSKHGANHEAYLVAECERNKNPQCRKYFKLPWFFPQCFNRSQNSFRFRMEFRIRR